MTVVAKRNFWSAGLVLLTFSALAGVLFFVQQRERTVVPPLRHDAVMVAPNGTHYNVEIADDDAERMLGLSFQPSMAAAEGKLFVFPGPALHSFWMKDMRFPLDILWIQDGVVVDLAEEVPAPGLGQFPATVVPQAPAHLVLELQAGEAKRQGITRGTTLDIQWPSGYSWPAIKP
jgi:uncharacterized membrane protein (UPF0127 family)